VIVFVGEAPGGTLPVEAGACWRRLAAVVGTTPAVLWQRAVLVNTLKRRPERDGHGDAFPLKAARRAAVRLAGSALLTEARMIVLVGRRVSRAFGVARQGYFVPFCLDAVHPAAASVVIPHPSGVNLWYNDPQHRRLARRELRQILGLESA
jgi:hypothetical protein